MERITSSLSCTSFWKLLMDEDFNRGIRIPNSFSSELEGRKSPCNFWLITEDKKRSWRAKLVKKDHYFYLCRKSWPEFVRHHKLKHGDLLLFHLTADKYTLWVTPYGANGSKKKLDDDEDSDDSSDDDDDSDSSEPASDVVRTPMFHRQDNKHKRKERGGSRPMSKKARKSSDHVKDYYSTDESDQSGEDGADEQRRQGV